MGTHRKKKILFIGFGNLAKSILNKDLKINFGICTVNSKEKINHLNQKKISKPKFDIVFLLVKPNIFYKNGENFTKYLNKNTIVISFMAGVRVKTISNTLNTVKVVRVMPNLLSLYNKSHTCIFSNNSRLSNWTAKNITNLFGNSFIIKKESDIHKATVLFGSGPAFIASIINSYIKAAEQLSFNNSKNNKPILDMFKSVIDYSDKFGGLDNFIKSITSKKGVTYEGLKYLNKSNLKKTISLTFNRSYKRSKELGYEKK